MVESKLWHEYLNRAWKFMTDGRLDSEEVRYKLDIGEDLKKARDAVLSASSDWPALVNKGLTNNLVNWQAKVPFSEWFEDDPNDALRAMQAFWAEDSTPVSDRIRAFVPAWSKDQGARILSEARGRS